MPMDLTKLINQTEQREAIILRESADEENRTVEIAFSSEAVVPRWFGNEILDHGKGACDLTRINNAGALLCDHDRSCQVGVIESARIDKDKVGRAVVRFSKNNPRAEQEFRDVQDGIRQHVSVGYRILEAVLEKTGEDEVDTYRITRWEPIEISLISIPADISVGVGRSDAADILVEGFKAALRDEAAKNPDVQPSEQLQTYISESEERQVPNENPNPTPNPAQVVDESQIRKAERTRSQEILAMGDKHQMRDLATEFIINGKSVDEFRAAVLDKMGEPRAMKVPENPADIGMSDKEVRGYSLVRAIHAKASGDWKNAGLELEASRAVAQRMGKDPQGFFMPYDVQRRDLNVTTSTAGGHTVATELLSESFIDLLRNKMVTNQLGARTLSGLNGQVAIPRQTGGATSYWVAESGSPTESQQAFDQVTMSPKTVGAFTDISRKLLLQSSMDVEAFVRGDLATVLALAIDNAGINGTGASNQPTGILATSGIGSVAGGTNGAAPTWGNVVDLETAVANANADIGNLAYLTNTKVRGKLKQTQFASNLPFIWGTGDQPLNGYKAAVSNQVPSNLTKGTSSGVCSALIFGNFSDLIYGLWGALDILVDPYSQSTSGTVRIVALQDVDVAVRHAQSFAAMLDALTA